MKSPNMPLLTVSAAKFSWSPGGKTAAADISDFYPDNNWGTFRRQVWDDACDVGFLVQGKREKHLFLFSHEGRGSDRDLRHVIFVDQTDLARYIIIYND